MLVCNCLFGLRGHSSRKSIYGACFLSLFCHPPTHSHMRRFGPRYRPGVRAVRPPLAALRLNHKRRRWSGRHSACHRKANHRGGTCPCFRARARNASSTMRQGVGRCARSSHSLTHSLACSARKECSCTGCATSTNRCRGSIHAHAVPAHAALGSHQAAAGHETLARDDWEGGHVF